MLLVVPLQLDKTLLKIVTTIFYMYGELSVNKPLFTLFTSSDEAVIRESTQT